MGHAEDHLATVRFIIIKILREASDAVVRSDSRRRPLTFSVPQVEKECLQIRLDIIRIANGQRNEDKKLFVTFGVLFTDEFGEQFYESLVGTLKAARSRGIIAWKGQMLLKGAHDNVEISLIKEDESDLEAPADADETVEAPAE